jgi:hypothetical protein
MTSNQVLYTVAKVGKSLNRPQVVRWCLKKRQQQLRKSWTLEPISSEEREVILERINQTVNQRRVRG